MAMELPCNLVSVNGGIPELVGRRSFWILVPEQTLMRDRLKN